MQPLTIWDARQGQLLVLTEGGCHRVEEPTKDGKVVLTRDVATGDLDCVFEEEVDWEATDTINRRGRKQCRQFGK